MGQYITGPAELEPYKEFMRIKRDVIYMDNNRRLWLTPRGWISDGASLPWIIQWKWKPYDERYVREAFTHDARFCAHDASFADSNKLFKEGLESCGWKYSQLFYVGVSSPWGWYSYNFIPTMEENIPLLKVIEGFNYAQDHSIRIHCDYQPDWVRH